MKNYTVTINAEILIARDAKECILMVENDDDKPNVIINSSMIVHTNTLTWWEKVKICWNIYRYISQPRKRLHF